MKLLEWMKLLKWIIMMTDENTTIGTLGEEAGGDMSEQEIEVFENGEWEIHKSDSPTTIKVSRISRKKENKKHNVALKNNDSESVDEADDSDHDPDFDIRSEYPNKVFVSNLKRRTNSKPNLFYKKMFQKIPDLVNYFIMSTDLHCVSIVLMFTI
ncbi:hypothetical protein LSTR_LSTR013340 [Laodelphax striatellus]|uniref:Uncharacterized protein n=1 Tax=Laodelphax striatellus TaxID=195883 RepID=A0A482XB31_LAOST|nr:hypothetical protein LSTR_LSTR013340 [Laodelphax striatellus]